MLHRIVQVYVVLSAILLLSWIGYTALFNATDYNPGAVYCDYHVAGQPGAGGERLPEANWAALVHRLRRMVQAGAKRRAALRGSWVNHLSASVH